MRYEYEVDYGDGYADAFPSEREAMQNEDHPTAWLARVEAEGTARRARVLSGSEVIEERDFGCSITQSSILPDGSVRYMVQCAGGQVTVERQTSGALSGNAQSGYVGDTDRALERAFESVRRLNEP